MSVRARELRERRPRSLPNERRTPPLWRALALASVGIGASGWLTGSGALGCDAQTAEATWRADVPAQGGAGAQAGASGSLAAFGGAAGSGVSPRPEPVADIELGKNLLRNPGFEDGTTGWTTQGKVRASGAHGGERALELGSPLTLDQDVENLGAGSYRASLFVKAPGAAKKLYFVIYDPTYSTVHAAEWNVSPSDAWHEARVEFTLSAEQAAAGVKLSLTFEATSPGALLLVDDASLATLERRPAASSKKGVILSAFQGTRAADLGAAWFSNWGTTSFGVPSALEFVPIIVDLTQATADDYARAKASGAATLLGFYEPHQRGLSVEQALSEWPRFMETGLRLGSPSGDEAWLDAFMRGAAERGHRVDFVAVTYYPDVTQADAVTRFEASLSALHQKYSLPIWVTAFGAMSWSSARPLEQADLDRFIRGAVPMLERLPYVERYAWFADRMKPEDGLIGSLLEPTGDELTPTGVTYLNRLR